MAYDITHAGDALALSEIVMVFHDITSDLAWQARHSEWLLTDAGRAYTMEQARPWADRAADIRAEHAAEALRDARQADARAHRVHATTVARSGAPR